MVYLASMFQESNRLSDFLNENTSMTRGSELPLKDYKFIDLFSGIGGIRIPFEEAGADCVFSSEIDKFACMTYQSNFGCENMHGDITEIDVKDIPKFDILLAGFPCQPFSNAGHKKGFEDTRGTLFFKICEILNHHHPEVVFLENVKGLKNHNKGKTFEVIKRSLTNLGYNVFSEVLNAKDFGLPQNRERIYIVCFKNNNEFTFPDKTLLSTKVGDILDQSVEEKYTISDRLWSGHQRRKAEHKSKGNGFGYSLFTANSEYTSTISARYYKDGSEILIHQDCQNPRKITPREASRLQGFPDDFIIPVSDIQAYKQFGNSVAVPVIRAICKRISLNLNRKDKSSSHEDRKIKSK